MRELKSKGLRPVFVVEMTPKAALSPEFEKRYNRWYKKHFGLMLGVPGIKLAYRYVSVGRRVYLGTPTEPVKKYMAYYELRDEKSIDKILSSKERRKALNDPEWKIFSPHFDTRRYVYLPLYRRDKPSVRRK